MQSLQVQASEKSGVSQEDAFEIDQTNLYERLGHQCFINLSTNFYTRVYADTEQWFRDIFANATKEEAIQNQYEFFIQRMGGPALYTQRKDVSEEHVKKVKRSGVAMHMDIHTHIRFLQSIHFTSDSSQVWMGLSSLASFSNEKVLILGHPALIGRHGPYAVSTAAAHRWLHHMDLALNETEEIDPESRKRMLNFFRHTAFFLVAGKELVNTQRIVGYGGKHTGGA